MNNRPGWLLSLFAATLVPTLLPTVYFSVVMLTSPYPNWTTLFLVFIVAFVTALGHVAFLGIPGVLVLSRARQLKAWTVCALGFFCGCLPMAMWTWPLQASRRGASSSEWDGEKMVHSIVNGVPTLTGWINYGEGVATMGALGAAAAAVFWLTWKYTGRPHRIDVSGA